MSIYDVTFSKLGQQVLPPDKRNSKIIAFVTCLLAPMQWLRDLWLGSYCTGASTAYNSSTTYAKYAQVVYNKTVYSSLQSGNVGNVPVFGSIWWTPIQTNFIGLSERIVYNGQTLVLTYALNKWFGTTFVQPNSKKITYVLRASNVATITVVAHGLTTGQYVYISGLSNTAFNGVYQITVTGTDSFTYPNTGSNLSVTSDAGTATRLSDIYILNNSLGTVPFQIGKVESDSSATYNNTSPQFIINAYSFATRINFSIYVPSAVYTALASTDANRQAIFKSFADKYIPAGIIYQIQTY
jgi:hypothetical protein